MFKKVVNYNDLKKNLIFLQNKKKEFNLIMYPNKSEP